MGIRVWVLCSLILCACDANEIRDPSDPDEMIDASGADTSFSDSSVSDSAVFDANVMNDEDASGPSSVDLGQDAVVSDSTVSDSNVMNAEDASGPSSVDLGQDAAVDSGLSDALVADVSPMDQPPPDAAVVDAEVPCGNGRLDDGEACDDGNDDDTDDCTTTCRVARCGDAITHAGVEACDDGNDDDTDGCLTTCEVARCGDGHVQRGVEECDDGNGNDDDRCTAQCRLNLPCEPLPAECRDRDNWRPGLDEHFMQNTDACVFALDAPTEQAWAAGVDLATRLGDELPQMMHISEVLDDLNRQGRTRVTNQTATRMRNHDFRGWTWNDGDMGVSYWMPQGITGSSDASANGFVAGRRLMMVSWYHSTNARPTKGVRISLADLTEFDDIDYRHLLLAVPFDTAAGPNYTEAHYDHNDDRDALHAGGIVWYGDYLYVADTRVGLRVFDLSRVMRVSHTDQNGRIGRVNGRSDAHGYRYIIPQIARYRLSEGSCDLSFSAVSLDRSTNPPTLLSAEYRSGDVQGRLVHWPLDPETGRLMEINGQIFGRDARMSAQTRVQGALSYEGNYYISSSSQFTRFGRLYRTRPGRESAISAWVYGCEDLYYERRTGLIWTAAEFEDFRDVIGIPLPLP